MITKNLRVNQLSDATYQWYRDYLAAVDAKDIGRFGAFLADGCVMQMNSDEAVVGKPAVLDAVRVFWSAFGAVEHEMLAIYGTDDTFASEAIHHYTDADGHDVTVRAAAFMDRGPDGRLAAFRLYSDVGEMLGAG